MQGLTILEVTDQIDSRSYYDKKEQKQKSVQYQVCDLHVPDKRHPVDYELTYFDPERMLEPGLYYPSHESFYLGKFGLESGKYIRWIPIDDLKEKLQAIKKPASSSAK